MNNQARHTNILRNQKDYSAQGSEEIEGRVTKRLSQEFSGTENFILGALSQRVEFLLNWKALGHSGPISETPQNSDRENQETNQDRCQDDPHP